MVELGINQEEGMQFKKPPLKKIIIGAGVLIAVLSISFNVWGGINTAKNNFYQQAFNEGQASLNNSIMDQFKNTGSLMMNLPQPDGTTLRVQLIPTQSCPIE